MLKNLAISIIGLVSIAWAQAANMQFRHYNVDDEMPSDCVRGMLQDDYGYMWMATDGGVVRFDGTRFKTYRLESEAGDRDDNYAMSIAFRDGDLWVGSDAHLYKYDAQDDRFGYVPVCDRDGHDRPVNIRKIAIDGSGNVWVATLNMGVVRMQSQDGVYKTYNYPFYDTENQVYNIYVDSRDDIWALSARGDNSLYRLDKNADKFNKAPLKISGSQPASLTPTAMAEDFNQMLWVGTSDGWLVSFDPMDYNGKALDTKNMPNGPLMHIHTIVPIEGGRLMIGSDRGLAYYDIAHRSFDLYKQDETDPKALSDQFVYPIVRDHEGGWWIGTFYGGVNYLPPTIKKFDNYQASRFRNSVSGNVVSRFVERPDHKIFVASDDNGLSLYDPANDTFAQIPLGDVRNLQTAVLDGNELWIGTYATGVLVLDAYSGAVKRKYNGDDVPDANSYAMLRDSKGQLWVGFGNTLCLYDRAHDSFSRVKNTGALIIDIDEDNSGRLWLCTQGQGVYAYNPANQVWTHYMYSSLGGKLPHNHVNTCTVDGQGRLWFGTDAGLVRYDEKVDDFVAIDMPFPNARVVSILDDQGVIWYGTPYGLVRQNPDERVEVYTRNDGLTSNQFIPNAMMMSHDGRIYLGSRAGFNAFYPHQIKANEIEPRVMITGVDINSQQLSPTDPRLSGESQLLKKVELHPGDHSIDISFAALSFTNPDKNQYRYRMKGFDKDWNYVGNTTHAFYANLPYGTYDFEVMGSNSDKLWSQSPAVIQVKVLPPWYLTWWMKTIYILLLGALVFMLIWQLIRRNHQKYAQELVKINSQKDVEVYEAKLNFFTMVAHEIRTPVSLIIGPLEKMMRNASSMPAKMVKDLSIIESNSQRLLVLVNQLLDFKKVEEQGINVRFVSTRLLPLIRTVADRFMPTYEQNNIELYIESDLPEDFECDIDPEAVTKLVSNLMNNARKFTRNRVVLTLTELPDNKNFSIAVSDNGEGIDKADIDKIFMPFFQVADANHSKGGTGLGLSIVQSMAVAHGGNVSVKSEKGVGTVFTAVLPIHQERVETAEEKTDVSDQAEQLLEPIADGEKPCMLVVDDNLELCNFIANSFDDKYRVLTAADGLEAIEKLKKAEVSLIISDWMMPKMDGVELCRAVRENVEWSHIPFVLLTAKTDDMSKIEGLNCGADAFVEKPFSLRVLEARIDNLLNMRKMLIEKFANSPTEGYESIAPHHADNEFMRQINAIIEENFSNPELDMDLLASKMDISRSGMYAKIRSLTDVTPNELIRLTRLKHAARLLLDGRYRINEVCYMVGFNSSSYFAKCFHRQFGVTPTEFVGNNKG